jgi:hypothetical protein
LSFPLVFSAVLALGVFVHEPPTNASKGNCLPERVAEMFFRSQEVKPGVYQGEAIVRELPLAILRDVRLRNSLDFESLSEKRPIVVVGHKVGSSNYSLRPEQVSGLPTKISWKQSQAMNVGSPALGQPIWIGEVDSGDCAGIELVLE